MAAKKTASKTSGKASVNVSVTRNKKTEKKTVSALKKTSLKAWLVGLVCLFVGVLVGAGVWFFVGKNDCFKIVGQDELSFTLSEHYKDEGVKIISLGKDLSTTAKIETNLKVDENGNYYAEDVGTYYIKYSSDDIKYGKIFKVEKVRLITFVEDSEDVLTESLKGGV